jgi:hypothetical protein
MVGALVFTLGVDRGYLICVYQRTGVLDSVVSVLEMLRVLEVLAR